MIRPGTPQDARFLRDMLRHAYYWRASGAEDETGLHPMRYVENWGRPGDAAVIALDEGHPVGAAWYRLFKPSAPGYGFVDERTPELSIAVVPSRRGHGFGGELMDALLARARAEGYAGISLSVAKDSPAVQLYERYGFEKLDEHKVYSQVEASFLPELVGWDDDGERPILVLEDLTQGHWPPPWREGDVDAVIDAL